jgi:hypothetical protein
MNLLATIVDWDALAQTALAALLSGVGVAFSFSIGILGAAKLSDPAHEHGVAGRIFFGGLVLLGMAATIGAIVFGLVVMTS